MHLAVEAVDHRDPLVDVEQDMAGGADDPVLEGLRAHGSEDQALPIATEHDAAVAEAEVLRLLDSTARPTALLAGGLQLLIGALRALDRRGLIPGRDIALVGWDDGPLPELSRPPRRWR